MSIPVKYKYRLVDERNKALDDRLLSVSQTRGVVPRSTLTDALPRAEDLSNYKVVSKGDVVINRMSAYEGALGIAPQSGIVSPEYMVLRPCSTCDGRYLTYLFKSTWFVAQMTMRVRGIGGTDQGNVRTPRLNPEDLGRIPVSLPTTARQRAIANYLDAETARIDTLIEKKRRLSSLLLQRWRSAAAHRILALSTEHGVIALRHLVTCLDGRRIPLSGEERADHKGEYPYYGASSIVDWVDDYLFDEDLVLVGEDGAQLGDPHYPISQRVSGKLWVNNHAHVLRPTAVDADLLVFHLNTFDRVPYVSGATREKITQDDLNRIPFPNISVDQQREEASDLLRVRDTCEATISSLDRQVSLLAEHRQALITAAVTGQLAGAAA